MSHDDEMTLRKTLCMTAQKLVDCKLNHGTTGNVSVRLDKNAFLITPSGISPENLSKDTIVKMFFSGKIEGRFAPSSEWQLHQDILYHRPDINAVIHVHSPFATTMACLQKDIPAFHYMIAVTGGSSIHCAPYALFGTKALSESALSAIKDKNACLLAHHGMVAVGRNLNHAFSIAVEVESLCEQYWRILQIGEPVILSEMQMHEVMEQFKQYGQWKKSSP